MLDKPEVTQTARQLTAIIHLTIPRDEIQEVMGPGLAEVRAVIAEQGIVATGPWFTHHLRMDPDIFDFEICVPVGSTVVATGRVTPGEWPAMKVARTVYRGPFEGLGDAWGEFDDWIEANGLTPGEDLWERYVKGPESGPDPDQWCTELNRPLVG